MSVDYGHCNYLFEFISYSNILNSWPQRMNIQRDMVGGLFLLAIPGILLANTYVGFAINSSNTNSIIIWNSLANHYTLFVARRSTSMSSVTFIFIYVLYSITLIR
jgi:hypothetical protein